MPSTSRSAGYTPPIGMNQQSVQSHELRYIDFLLPGILGMTLMFIGVQGGLPIIQQRQAHIIKRLGATPLRRSMLVLGDLVFRMIVILASAALIILVGRLVFDVQMVGNWFSLCGIVLLGSLVFVSLGYLIAALVKTQESALPVVQIVNLPMMILSGTFFDVASMPSFIAPLIKILPLDLRQRRFEADHGSRDSAALHDHGHCRHGSVGRRLPRHHHKVLQVGLGFTKRRGFHAPSTFDS